MYIPPISVREDDTTATRVVEAVKKRLDDLGYDLQVRVFSSKKKHAPKGTLCLWSEDLTGKIQSGSDYPTIIWGPSGNQQVKDASDSTIVKVLKRLGVPESLLLTPEEINSPFAPWVREGPYDEV